MYAGDESSSLIMQMYQWGKMKFYVIDYDCQFNKTFFFRNLQNKIVLKMHAGDKRSSLIMQKRLGEKIKFYGID
jgi:hypothetical protein